MNNATIKRGATLTAMTSGFLVLLAAIVWACVPQVGTLEVVSEENNTEVNSAEENVIVGDGNPNTLHFNSWCEDHGGHPVDAVEAGLDDDITVTINQSNFDQVNGACPDEADPDEDISSLPEGTTHIFVNNGDAYIWDDGDDPDADYTYDGFWNFTHADSDTKGCYADGENPAEQDTFQYDGSSEKSHTFTLTDDGQNWQDPDDTNQPGENASVLCVGEPLDAESPTAIFAPLVVTSV